jgi:hypothetical protein
VIETEAIEVSDTSGKAFMDHWTWAADKGLMNTNTAGGMRAAVTKVLSIEENPEQVDITKLDVDGILRRFENLKKKDFTPGSLETYKSRFRQAIKSYRDYIDSPSGWHWVARERPAGESSGNGAKPKRRTALVPAASVPDNAEQQPTAPRGKTIDFAFPLREGVMAHLWLPADLKQTEVKRLHAFMSTLVVDDSAS